MSVTAENFIDYHDNVREAVLRKLKSYDDLAKYDDVNVLVKDAFDHDDDPILLIQVAFSTELEEPISWNRTHEIRRSFKKILEQHNIQKFAHLVFTTKKAVEGALFDGD